MSANSRACAALPLLSHGESVSVLLFISERIECFHGPSWSSFCSGSPKTFRSRCENFDRADENAVWRTNRGTRLTRMFAALSETNEAIMRPRPARELFELVCEAAVHGGQFTSTIIALAEPGSDFMRVVAAAGPTAAKCSAPSACRRRGASGGPRDQRHRVPQPQACISNDYLADPRGQPFHDRARREGNASRRLVSAVEPRQGRSACLLFLRASGRIHARVWSNCCSAWRTTFPSRSTISTAPTKRRRRTSGSNIWRRMTA